jgi:pimeloyl-ACP methyl ester carboxylesterase
VTLPTAHVGEVALFHTDEGPREGPALLLVHGWTCDSHDWCFQLEELTTRHRVIAVDLRGHGRSSTPSSGYDPHTLAADLAALLTRLGVDPVVAVGHSLGGLVVAALAVEHPDTVRATVAVDPAYGVGAERAAHLPALLAALGRPDGLETLTQVLAASESTGSPESAGLRHWHRRRVLGGNPEVIREVLRGMYFAPDQFGLRPQTEAFLTRRRQPALAFHRDAELAAWESGLATSSRDAVVHWPGTGHWLQQERATDFNRELARWVGALSG